MAENLKYGQTISEGGMGGKTTESGGSANQGMRLNHAVAKTHPIGTDMYG